MTEVGSGVKFESKQAERNIDSFVRKVGTLASKANEAKAAGRDMATAWNSANAKIASAGADASKASKGILSFGTAAKSAATAARGLIGALDVGKINSAARGLSAIATSAGAAGAAMRTASGSARSLGTDLGRAADRGTALAGALRSVNTAAQAAGRNIKSMLAGMDMGKIAQSTRYFNSLVGSFRTVSARMSTFRGDVNTTVNYLNRVGTSSTKATQGLNRIGNSLAAVLPKLLAANTAAAALAASFDRLGGVSRVTASVRMPKTSASVGGGNAPVPPAGASSAWRGYASSVGVAKTELSGMADKLVSFRNLFKFYIAGLGISNMVELADTANLVSARLKILGQSTAVTAELEQRLQNVTIRTRSEYDANAKLFVKLAQAGKNYGVSMGTALTITENVSKALKISGATAAEAANSTLQLSQAFSSGKLQGDELRSVLENAPRLAQAFAEGLKDLGVNLGNIRKFGKQGKLGIDEMVKVLANPNLTKALTKEFAMLPATIGDSLVVLKNKFMFWLHDMDRALGVSTKITGAIQFLGNHMQTLGQMAALAGSILAISFIPSIIRATVATAAFLALNLAAVFTGTIGAITGSASAIASWGSLMAGAASGAEVLALAMMALPWVALAAGAVAAGVALYRYANSTDYAGQASKKLADYKAYEAFNKAADGADIASGSIDKYATAAALASTTTEEAASTLNGLMDSAKVAAAAEALAGGGADIMGGKFDAAKAQADGLIIKLYGVRGAALLAAQALAQADLAAFQSGKETSKEAHSGWAGVGGVARMVSGVLGVVAPQASKDADTYFYQNRANKADAAVRTMKETAAALNVIPPGLNTTNTPTSSGGNKNKGGGGTKEKADELGNALQSLKEQLDPVEASRKKFNDGVDTLSKSMAAGKLSSEEYARYLGLLGSDTFDGLTDKIKDANDENAKLRAVASGAPEPNKDLVDAQAAYEKQMGTIDAIIAKQGDQTGELGRQKDVLTDQLGRYKDIIADNETLKKQGDERIAKEKEIADLVQNAMQKTQEAFVSQIQGFLDGSKSFLKSWLGMAKSLFAQYLGNALFAEIRAPLQSAIGSALGQKKKQDTLGSGGVVGAALGSSGSANGGGGFIEDVVRSGPDKVINNFTINAANDNGAHSTVSGTNKHAENDDIVVTGKRSTGVKGFLPNLRSGYTDTFKSTIDFVGKAFEPVGKAFGKVFKKLGVNTDGIGRALGGALGGAQIGSGIAELGKALGIKTSSAGGAIGGAIGGLLSKIGPIASALGPIGAALGPIMGIAGSLLGGLFSKPKQGNAVVSGQAKADVAVSGNSAAEKSTATGLAGSVQAGIKSIADALGGTIGGYKVSIGTFDGKYRVDPGGRTGSMDSKHMPGVVDFGGDAQAALRFAIADAVKDGAIQGLSKVQQNVLATFDDLDKAIQTIQTLQSLHQQAITIKDPTKGAMEDFKKQMTILTNTLKEAGAGTEEWSDFLTVATKGFTDAVEASTKGLRDFLDNLKGGDMSYLSAYNKLGIADDKFKAFEGKINKGDFSFTQDEFTQAGTTLQGLARDTYGSTPEFAAFQQRLIDATQKVLDNAQATADQYKPVVDAIKAQTEKQSSDTSKVVEALNEINDNFSNDRLMGLNVFSKWGGSG